MVTHWSMVERSNAEGNRCINSVFASVLTKDQGGVILLKECTKLQELKKIENVTNRV